MSWILDLRALGSGGGIALDVAVYRGDILTPVETFQQELLNKDLLFATHGFNVDRLHGRASLTDWEAWHTLPADTVFVGVLWPGDSAWIPVIDYPIEGNEAIAAGNVLARFITSALTGASTVSFSSHSLGARMVLQTIRGLSRAGRRVRRLMLMAGAIDDNCLSNEYADAAACVDAISVLSSYHDQVLHLAFPVGNFFSGIVTRGDPYWHAALGREGPSSTLEGKVQSGWQIPNSWHYGHHDYLPTVMPAAPPWSLPVGVPPLADQVPVWATYFEWQQAFSAGVNSTRLR